MAHWVRPGWWTKAKPNERPQAGLTTTTIQQGNRRYGYGSEASRDLNGRHPYIHSHIPNRVLGTTDYTLHSTLSNQYTVVTTAVVWYLADSTAVTVQTT